MDRTDDNYGRALQRLMKHCLPPILVEIVDTRPPDPIDYLARALYRYREREDSETFSSLQPSEHQNEMLHHHNPNSVHQSSGVTESTSQHNQTLASSSNASDQAASSGQHCKLVSRETDDELVNSLDDRLVVYDHKSWLHKECITVLTLPGDLCDDYDVS